MTPSESTPVAAPLPAFFDATPLLGDGPALRERLAEDGYLFVRGLIDRDALLEVRARLLAKAAAGGWLDSDQPVSAGVADPAAACKDPEEGYMAVFRTLWADEQLHRLRTRDEVLGLFESLWDAPVLAHPMFVQRNIFPQTQSFDFTTGVHQDRIHIGGATSYAMWVPLGDCPLEKGPLSVAAGSHKTGILDTRVGNGAGGMEISVPIPGTWRVSPFEAGDVLIFQDTTVHRALPNRSREIRQSFDARYQPASEPIAETNMVPYSGTGTWESIYATWTSTDDQYYWRALDPTVVPLDRRYYERRDQMAFEMAERGEQAARDTLLRIIQRDPDPEKRARAKQLLTGVGPPQ